MSRPTVNKRREQRADARLARMIVGRTIVKAEPHGGAEGDPPLDAWMHSWVLTLDDGAQLVFVTEEHPDCADYGVRIIRREPPRSPT